MKTTGIIAATIVMAMSAIGQTTWTVDNVHSNVRFTVSHLVISEVDGKFDVYSGTIDAPEKDFTGAKIEFSVDVKSIDTGNEMRDNHLKADDFFSAEKFPHMTFKGVSFKKVNDKNYVLEGDLTIRDVTKRATFNVVHGGTVQDPYGNTKAGFKATTVIDRFAYGLKWNALTEAGGATVGRDVMISLNLQFAQKKAS